MHTAEFNGHEWLIILEFSNLLNPSAFTVFCACEFPRDITNIAEKRFDFASLGSEVMWVMIHSSYFRITRRPWLQICWVDAELLPPKPPTMAAQSWGLTSIAFGDPAWHSLFSHLSNDHHCSNSSSMSSDQQAWNRHTIPPLFLEEGIEPQARLPYREGVIRLILSQS